MFIYLYMEERRYLQHIDSSVLSYPSFINIRSIENITAFQLKLIVHCLTKKNLFPFKEKSISGLDEIHNWIISGTQDQIILTISLIFQLQLATGLEKNQSKWKSSEIILLFLNTCYSVTFLDK